MLFDNQVIKIYQTPLFERILSIFSVLLTALPLISLGCGLAETKEEYIVVFVMLVVFILYDVIVYFTVFQTYICFDLKKGNLTVKEYFKLKKTVYDIKKIKEIKFSDGEKYKDLFSIDIIFNGYTKKITSWSEHPNIRVAIFNRYNRQKRRLMKFSDTCNRILYKINNN